MSPVTTQSPVSALLMLEGLAWALERLPAPAFPSDRRWRDDLVVAARDAARASIEQHEEWTAEQLVRARECSSGEWGREILRALHPTVVGPSDRHPHPGR